MNTIKVIGSPLYQWEIGRQVQIFPMGRLKVSYVHFSHLGDTEALVVVPTEKDGRIVADIPNILLQSDQNLVVYVVDTAENCVETLRECVLPVRKRAKPTDYVYTETEVLNYAYLDKRLKDLEGEGLANAVAEYLKENPVEAGATAEEAAQIEQNKTDIATLDRTKLAASELPTAVNEALAQAKASGAFDGEPGKDGRPGADGYTPQKNVDYFDGKDGDDYVLTEADKQEIAEQAAGMVEVPKVDIPTTLPNPNALTFTGAATGTYDGSAPLTVNIPEGGGGGEWKLLGSADNLEADVYGIEIETDVKGNAFSVNELYIYGVFITTGTADSSLKINLNDKLTISCMGCAMKNTVTNRGVHIDIVKKAGVVRPSWMMHGGSNTTSAMAPVINKYTSTHTIDQIVGKDDIDEIRKISLALGDSNAFSTTVCYRVYGR